MFVQSNAWLNEIENRAKFDNNRKSRHQSKTMKTYTSPHQSINRPKYFMISLWANLRDGSEKYKKTREIPKLGIPKEKVR